MKAVRELSAFKVPRRFALMIRILPYIQEVPIPTKFIVVFFSPSRQMPGIVLLSSATFAFLRFPNFYSQ
jgi:hypothetical protein